MLDLPSQQPSSSCSRPELLANWVWEPVQGSETAGNWSFQRDSWRYEPSLLALWVRVRLLLHPQPFPLPTVQRREDYSGMQSIWLDWSKGLGRCTFNVGGLLGQRPFWDAEWDHSRCQRLSCELSYGPNRRRTLDPLQTQRVLLWHHAHHLRAEVWQTQ